jgi:hypothetical protein
MDVAHPASRVAPYPHALAASPPTRSHLGTGITPAEHAAVVADNDALRREVAELQAELLAARDALADAQRRLAAAGAGDDAIDVVGGQ